MSDKKSKENEVMFKKTLINKFWQVLKIEINKVSKDTNQ